MIRVSNLSLLFLLLTGENISTEFCNIQLLLFYEKFKYQDFDFLREKKNKIKTSYNVKIK